MALYDAMNGPGPKKPKPLNFKQINEWGDWADKNVKPGDTVRDLYQKFKKDNPNTDIDQDDLMDELETMRLKVQESSKRQGQGRDFDYINTGNTFPTLEVDGKSYGRMNRDLKAENSPEAAPPVPESMLVGEIPSGLSQDKLSFVNGYVSWEDPQSGDIVFGKKSLNWKDPRAVAVLKKRKEAFDELGREGDEGVSRVM
jgi:hypothetical protein